jgi:trypsin
LNDIALLKLAYPVNLSRKIQLACLPNTLSHNYPNTNQASWAVGWGTIDFGGPTSELLRMVKLNIYDNHVCKYVSPENAKNWSKFFFQLKNLAEI